MGPLNSARYFHGATVIGVLRLAVAAVATNATAMKPRGGEWLFPPPFCRLRRTVALRMSVVVVVLLLLLLFLILVVLNIVVASMTCLSTSGAAPVTAATAAAAAATAADSDLSLAAPTTSTATALTNIAPQWGLGEVVACRGRGWDLNEDFFLRVVIQNFNDLWAGLLFLFLFLFLRAQQLDYLILVLVGVVVSGGDASASGDDKHDVLIFGGSSSGRQQQGRHRMSGNFNHRELAYRGDDYIFCFRAVGEPKAPSVVCF